MQGMLETLEFGNDQTSKLRAWSFSSSEAPSSAPSSLGPSSSPSSLLPSGAAFLVGEDDAGAAAPPSLLPAARMHKSALSNRCVAVSPPVSLSAHAAADNVSHVRMLLTISGVTLCLAERGRKPCVPP